MSKVDFRGKTVSDDDLKEVLKRIARSIGSVHITSGDRGFVPKGGSKTSLHLQHQAVDFGILGLSLEEGFIKLAHASRNIFTKGNSYEVIWHGPYTNTNGPHLHIGRFSKGSGVVFKKEGDCEENKGKYIEVRYC